MTDIDIDRLTQDLRSRINPAYADVIGTESYERKQCAVALEKQRNQIVLFATELERLRCLLHDSLYAGSKDWRESNLAGRIEWLITMYESAKDEVERLQAELKDRNELICQLQNELRSYKEREKVWGWNHD